MPIPSVLHILQTIKDRGPISRTDLQQVTGLSWGTVTNTTRDLLNRKFIREQGAVSTKAGRKPVQLALNLDAHCLTGVELLPGEVRILMLNLAGATLWQTTFDHAAALPGVSEALRDEIIAHIRQGHAAVGPRAHLGVGIVLPGATPASADSARDCDALRAALESQLQMPVLLEQPANALALAHRWFAQTPAATCDDFICIHLGDSVQLGIVARGEIFRGHSGRAGQLAHISLDPHGPLCACGRRGCTDVYCAAHALLAAAIDAPTDGTPHTLADLISHASDGHGPSVAALERLGTHLGAAIVMLVRLFDPALVVLAGQTTAAARHFMPALERHLAEQGTPAKVMLSPLSENAAAMGVCALLLQNAFAAQSAAATEALPA